MQKHCWIGNAENRRLLVEMWSGYVNWMRREKAENGWLIHQLNSHNCNKVFDAALGDGCDSIRLIKAGFCVTSNDVDRLFILKAVENAIKHKVQLKITNLDWRELNKKIPPQSFDAVLCLGNSFTCLFDLKSQIKAITQFHSITKNGGILLIDERNYQHILDNRRKILSGQLVSTGEPLYCGKNVHSRPIEIKKSRSNGNSWTREQKRERMLSATRSKKVS